MPASTAAFHRAAGGGPDGRNPVLSDEPRRCRNALRDPPPAARILVVRLGALGDVVRTLPAVAALRRGYPAAHIAWLVEPAAAPLLEHQRPLIDEVLVAERGEWSARLRALAPLAAARELRPLLRRLRGAFDLVVDFHSILRSAVLVRASAAPLRIGFAAPTAREGAAFAYTHRAQLGERAGAMGGAWNRFDRNAALVEFLGLPVGAREIAYRMRVDDEASGRVCARLSSPEFGHAGRERGAFALLHPGASSGAAHKRWSESSYATLARGLRDRVGLPSFVAAGPSERERASAARIAAASGGCARVAPETRDAGEFAALATEARIFIGADSGPLHIASLCGTPVVQLLGPTHPVHNEPWPGTPWRRVYRPAPCSPCRRGCGNPICMSAIAPDDVLGATLSLLEATVRRSGGERSDVPAGEAS